MHSWSIQSARYLEHKCIRRTSFIPLEYRIRNFAVFQQAKTYLLGYLWARCGADGEVTSRRSPPMPSHSKSRIMFSRVLLDMPSLGHNIFSYKDISSVTLTLCGMTDPRHTIITSRNKLETERSEEVYRVWNTENYRCCIMERAHRHLRFLAEWT